MDLQTAKFMMNRELDALGRRRREAQAQVEDLGLQIGATTTYLRDNLGQSKAASAQRVGLSPSHLTELMSKAEQAGTVVDDPLDRVPALQGPELQEFVLRHGGVARIISSFGEYDVLYMSGLDPARLLDQDLYPRVHMVLQTGDGAWSIVDNVQVGYVGTGPGNAARELAGLGLDPELVDKIAYSRVSDVRVIGTTSTDSLHEQVWPHLPLDGPLALQDFYVVPVTSIEEPTYRTKGASEPVPTDTSRLQAWLDYLDTPAGPEWLSGPRRARVYLDREAARAAGYSDTSLSRSTGRSGSTYTLIVEQGRLQLWIDVPASNDPSQLYSPEMFAALSAAGFYVADQAGVRSGRAFWNWLGSRGKVRPPFVDLDDQPLRHQLSAAPA